MARLHVLFNKDHVDQKRIAGKVVIVIDVVFATTSIATALEHGAREIVPALDENDATQEASRRAEGTFVLAGELEAVTLPGFVDSWPGALALQPLDGKSLIYSTSNGTVALNRVRGAAHVYAGALVNGEALVRHVISAHDGLSVILLCAGAGEAFTLEDFYGAGYCASLLMAAADYWPTDAAVAAMLLHDSSEALDCIRRSRIGRVMTARALDHELAFAAQKSVLASVPRFSDGRLVRA
jgi:2-phosphosulfolactate phosphatase